MQVFRPTPGFRTGLCVYRCVSATGEQWEENLWRKYWSTAFLLWKSTAIFTMYHAGHSVNIQWFLFSPSVYPSTSSINEKGPPKTRHCLGGGPFITTLLWLILIYQNHAHLHCWQVVIIYHTTIFLWTFLSWLHLSPILVSATRGRKWLVFEVTHIWKEYLIKWPNKCL